MNGRVHSMPSRFRWLALRVAAPFVDSGSAMSAEVLGNAAPHCLLVDLVFVTPAEIAEKGHVLNFATGVTCANSCFRTSGLLIFQRTPSVK